LAIKDVITLLFSDLFINFIFIGDVISADNFTEKPERMVLELKRVRNLKWIWMPV